MFDYGTYRAIAPRETLRAVAPYLSALGITRVADVTGMDCVGLPVITAHRPNSRSLSVTQGKGISVESARASAIMEAMERHCAEEADIPLRYASANELQRDQSLIALDRLPRLADSKLNLDAKVLWAEAFNLDQNSVPSKLWVPFELVHLDYTLPLPPTLGCFLLSSNGLAAGNTQEEAVFHALCELVERDAVTLWRLRDDKAKDCRVSLSSIADEICGDILARFKAAGVSIAIWDITTDIGLPAFFVTIIDTDSGGWRGLYAASGSGCHPNRSIALSRALCEAAQSRLTRITGSRDDHLISSYRVQLETRALERLRNEVLEDQGERSFCDVANFREVRSFEDTNARLRERFLKLGFNEPAIVDLSKSAFPASVVRTFVPGLEGPSDAPGYMPGERGRSTVLDVRAA